MHYVYLMSSPLLLPHPWEVHIYFFHLYRNCQLLLTWMRTLSLSVCTKIVNSRIYFRVHFSQFFKNKGKIHFVSNVLHCMWKVSTAVYRIEAHDFQSSFKFGFKEEMHRNVLSIIQLSNDYCIASNIGYFGKKCLTGKCTVIINWRNDEVKADK